MQRGLVFFYLSVLLFKLALVVVERALGDSPSVGRGILLPVGFFAVEVLGLISGAWGIRGARRLKEGRFFVIGSALVGAGR